MNSTIYLFGKFKNGYNQYPLDDTRRIFEMFYGCSSSNTQIIIHREDSLMYYGYIRKLDDGLGSYMGMCLLVNGVMINDIVSLFPIFENAISSMVVRGKILEFNDNGDIVTSISALYAQKEEIAYIEKILRGDFDQFDDKCRLLPPVSYGSSNIETKHFSINDDASEIVRCSSIYGYTIIHKSNAIDTHSLSSYKGKLHRLNEEKNDLQKKYADLNSLYTKVQRQKKQYRGIALLGLVVIACLSFAIRQKTMLEEAQSDNDMLAQQNSLLSNNVDELQSNNNTLILSEKQLQATIVARNAIIDSLREDTLALNRRIEECLISLHESEEKYEFLYNTYSSEKREKNVEIDILKNHIAALEKRSGSVEASKFSVRLCENGAPLMLPGSSSKWTVVIKDKNIHSYDIDLFYDGQFLKTQQMVITRKK